MAHVRMRVPDLAWWPCDPQVRRHSSRLPVPWYTYQLAPEQLIGRLTWSVKRQRSLCSGSLIICTTATNDAQTLSSSHLRNPPDPTERPSTVELSDFPLHRNVPLIEEVTQCFHLADSEEPDHTFTQRASHTCTCAREHTLIRCRGNMCPRSSMLEQSASRQQQAVGNLKQGARGSRTCHAQ